MNTPVAFSGKTRDAVARLWRLAGSERQHICHGEPDRNGDSDKHWACRHSQSGECGTGREAGRNCGGRASRTGANWDGNVLRSEWMVITDYNFSLEVSSTALTIPSGDHQILSTSVSSV